MNTVCKEQKTKIMKKSNLDGGTSVGFSSDFILSGHENLPQGITTNKVELPVNTVCKEHEWVVQIMTITGGNTAKSTVCRKCGETWPHIEVPIKPIDFKISDNLEVIEDNKWDDIWIEYLGSDKFESLSTFYDFVKENYKAPEKK